MNAVSSGGVVGVDVRQRLRRSTSEMHEQVDQSLQRLLWVPDGYSRFLLATAVALLPLERALEDAGILCLVADWDARRRSPALEADLEDLGVELPRTRGAFVAPDAAYLIGVLYVLEGSRLGARHLLKVVRPAVSHASDARYLRHGEGKSFWSSFLRTMESSIVTEPQTRMAIEGAIFAFGQFLAASRRYELT